MPGHRVVRAERVGRAVSPAALAAALTGLAQLIATQHTVLRLELALFSREPDEHAPAIELLRSLGFEPAAEPRFYEMTPIVDLRPAEDDIFAALHALPAMALIVGSSYTAWQPLAALMFGFGLGMTIFGCAYAVIHDGLIHERLPIQFLLRFRVMRRIRGAHMRHHLNGEYPYGLFLGPQELRRAVLRGEG